MNDDPFASFKEAQPETKPEKKRRGRNKHAPSPTKIAAEHKPQPDDLEALSKIVLLLTPFSHKDQIRILKAIDTLLIRP